MRLPGLNVGMMRFCKAAKTNAGTGSTKSCDQRSDLGFASLGDLKSSYTCNNRRLGAVRLADNSSAI
jgi:hypothetical protein